MEKTTFYIGLNDKDLKIQTINILDAYKMAQNILLTKVNGATIYEASGIYKHESGEVITEQTLKIEILDTPEGIIDDLTESFKLVFNQESILIQSEEVNIKFV